MSIKNVAITVDKIDGDSAKSAEDHVAAEEPLEIRLGFSTPTGRTTKSVSITMRTPGHDAELAAGFLVSESIIQSADDIGLQRNFYTTSSCGVCGKSSMDALRVEGAEALAGGEVRFDRKTLIAMPERLRERQAAFELTGGLHAAAAFDSQGEILVVREDVGRHNAVDKVVGALLTRGLLPASTTGLIVSGRASFELMQKTLIAGIPLLAAVSAPSSLAVQLADEFNVSLVGFLRGDTFNIYTGGDRIN
jgi:FdhD protein